MAKGKKVQDSDSDISSDDDNKPKKSLMTRMNQNPAADVKPHQQEKDVVTGELDVDESDETPPFVVVVQGPKKSGKTTIIQSLVRHYTHHKVNDVAGTITLRTGKHNRITLIECPNDINAMIDLAKVADLCLLVVDASIGFEMETFEFLSILQVC